MKNREITNDLENRKLRNKILLQKLNIKLKDKQLKRPYLLEPAFVSISITAASILVAVFTALYQNNNQNKLEEKKFQYSIYEKALEIQNDTVRARMLEFYAKAELLPKKPGYFLKLLADSGYAGLPSYGVTNYHQFDNIKEVKQSPKLLCIYFGWPSMVNSSRGNVSSATSTFMHFDIIVFGVDLWKHTHSDYKNTLSIIRNIKRVSPQTRIFGYIDIGLSTTHLSDEEIREHVDGWREMGVAGVFGDNFGYDSGVTRNRQNKFVDYAHEKSLSVFVNSWNINDALEGEDCDLGPEDYCLLEGFLVRNGKRNPLKEFNQKIALAKKYKRLKGIKIACIATESSGGISSESNKSDNYIESYNAALYYGFDAFQFSETSYSSSGHSVYLFPGRIVDTSK